jgi:hypothetical protein
MKAQAILVNRDVRPDDCHQILLVNDLSCALDERDKDIKSATTQFDGTAVLLEKPFGYGQSKRSEYDDIVSHLDISPHPLGSMDGTAANRSFTVTVTWEIPARCYRAFTAAIKSKDSLPCASFR